MSHNSVMRAVAGNLGIPYQQTLPGSDADKCTIRDLASWHTHEAQQAYGMPLPTHARRTVRRRTRSDWDSFRNNPKQLEAKVLASTYAMPRPVQGLVASIFWAVIVKLISNAVIGWVERNWAE